MAEFDLGAGRFRSRVLNAVDQWHLLNRLRPLLPALSTMDVGLRPGIDLADLLASLRPLMLAADEDVRFVFRACLAACEVQDGEGWAPVVEPPLMSDLMRIVTIVVAENFGPLFAMKRPDFRAITVSGPTYTPVAMPDGEDWLYRPVLRKLCKVESLYDGTLRIEHLAKLADAIDVSDENEARARKAAEKR